MSTDTIHGLTIDAPVTGRYEEILTTEALELLADLHRTYEPRRVELLQRRAERQKELDMSRSKRAPSRRGQAAGLFKVG